jgi:hypothetical protein
MMTDVIQAVSFLAGRDEVDPGRIAAAGYSMGSFVLSLTCAVELRLKACVLVGGGNLDGPEGYWDNAKPMCQGTPYRSLAFLGDRAAAIYALHASRGATLIYNGREDTTVGIPQHGHRESFFEGLRDRTVRLRGSARGVFETGWVPAVGHRPHFVTRPVALWLEKQLDFSNWTEATLRAMPEIHVGQWARAHGVQLDPLYATEEREGGTPALGASIPAPSRQELSVFSAEHWQQEKSRMIHESWLAQAKSRISEAPR